MAIRQLFSNGISVNLKLKHGQQTLRSCFLQMPVVPRVDFGRAWPTTERRATLHASPSDPDRPFVKDLEGAKYLARWAPGKNAMHLGRLERIRRIAAELASEL